jgi:LmbE family N-acetylglucosaminyl deacetylase
MEQMTPVLVVTPHPDDAEGGAGGTIARWTKQGRKVILVVCTNGDKGTSDRRLTPDALVKIRAEEQRQAAAVLGIAEVVFLHLPDQGLEDCSVFRELLVRQIRIHRPETVVTVDPYRRYLRHRDHAICGRVTLDAVFPYARDHLAYPEHLQQGLEPHKVQEIYLWGSEEPDTFLDITETFSTKMAALYCHASQMKRSRDEREAAVRGYYAAMGKKAGVPLAEPFKRLEISR